MLGTSINFTANSPKSSSTILVGDWYLLTLDFEVPATYATSSPSHIVSVFPYNGGTTESYFDDFMVRPIDAEVTSYVYDKLTGQMTHVLDNNNFYTRNEYDYTGRIVATYKETLQGEVKTNSYKYNFGKQDAIKTGLPY
jgi:hypothetical protein